MNTTVIDECFKLSLEGNITFPEVIERLTEIEVERYNADLIGYKKFVYGVKDEFYIAALDFEGPNVPKVFNAHAVKNAISNIQQGKIKYQNFLHEIMNAGCSHYEVFISGKKAIYFGRDGSQHIELFPNPA